ncbi:PCRF domain-containing protein [bacterium]|nr:PCRF domain-containing protein [bacterium]
MQIMRFWQITPLKTPTELMLTTISNQEGRRPPFYSDFMTKNIFVSDILEKSNRESLKYLELEELISSPEIIAHNSYYRKLVTKQNSLKPIYEKRVELIKAIEELNIYQKNAENCEKEFFKLLSEEIEKLNTKIDNLANELSELLIPKKDSDKYAGAIVELKAGGEGSYGFCQKLFNMYQTFASKMCFERDIEYSRALGDGLKEAVFIIKGEKAYNILETESAVHIDRTEKQESSVTVCVLPYIEEEKITVGDKDIRIDLFHSGGAGGQNINKVETAVRITHIATGIAVVCQDERSQIKNKERAMKNLILRLKEEAVKSHESFTDAERKAKKSAIKKEKITRTYDFYQGTITDSRVKLPFRLEEVLQGNLILITNAIKLK